MFKITAIISLVLIGSTMWASSLSCDSCGSECTSACGTRHFRSCCFNYLRRKRTEDHFPLEKLLTKDFKSDAKDKPKHPVFVIESPEQWMTNVVSNEYRYPYDESLD